MESYYTFLILIIIISIVELVLYHSTVSNERFQRPPLTGLSASSYSRLRTGSRQSTSGLVPTAEKPVRIVVVQSNRDHYWCSCARRTVEDYVKIHDHYVLDWVIGEDLNVGEDDVKAAKMLKYTLALSYLPKSTLTVIMDCDVFVTNPNISILDIWKRWGTDTTDMIVARDAHLHLGVPINSGLIIVRDGDFVRSLFGDMIDKGRVDGGQFNADTLVDQPRLTVELIDRGQLLATPAYDTELHEHVSVVSQRVMNAFYRVPDGWSSGVHKDAEDSKWREGDWVAHVTGMQVEERVKAADMFGKGCVGIEDKTDGMLLTTDGEKTVGTGGGG
ncbi:hypothetical protein TrRE_jg8888 [Triparma retinervis]|uniref:Uncharacterized protein n=1 Tax=Triparma retinervis TaxID=2557542 RepID=A0A9W7DQD5_9STRA|nr:hypothetical protein TrRE_jg8888 [Triparma retinervis]